MLAKKTAGVGSYENPAPAVFRCRVDGELVTLEMVKQGKHLGHMMHEPAFPTLWEKFKLKIGLLK